MPAIIPCPKCGRQIRIADELLGKRVRCPQCSATFVVEPVDEEGPAPAGTAVQPAPTARRRAAPPPEDEGPPRPRRRPRDEDEYEDDRPRRGRRAAEEAVGWRRVRTGPG